MSRRSRSPQSPVILRPAPGLINTGVSSLTAVDRYVILIGVRVPLMKVFRAPPGMKPYSNRTADVAPRIRMLFFIKHPPFNIHGEPCHSRQEAVHVEARTAVPQLRTGSPA